MPCEYRFAVFRATAGNDVDRVDPGLPDEYVIDNACARLDVMEYPVGSG